MRFMMLMYPGPKAETGAMPEPADFGPEIAQKEMSFADKIERHKGG